MIVRGHPINGPYQEQNCAALRRSEELLVDSFPFHSGPLFPCARYGPDVDGKRRRTDCVDMNEDTHAIVIVKKISVCRRPLDLLANG